MKKAIALFLSLAMLLGCTGAWAETAEIIKEETEVNGKFTARWICPEGYISQSLLSSQDGIFISIEPEGDQNGKTAMLVSVAPDEMYADVVRLNDLDEEALKMIENTFREEDEVEISYMETNFGTKLMVVKESHEGVDFVDFYTIYMGYSIELVMTSATFETDAAPITDEQIQLAVQFLSNLEFIPAA